MARDGGKGEKGGGGRGEVWGKIGNQYLSEVLVVGLFGGADFDGAHHFAGGDDDAAEDFGRAAGHGSF